MPFDLHRRSRQRVGGVGCAMMWLLPAFSVAVMLAALGVALVGTRLLHVDPPARAGARSTPRPHRVSACARRAAIRDGRLTAPGHERVVAAANPGTSESRTTAGRGGDAHGRDGEP